MPDFLAETSPKLKRARAEAREKVLELFEKGKIPETVSLGEGASYEQIPPDLETLAKTDEFLAAAVVDANAILQAPGNTASFEDGKVVVRDKNSHVLAEIKASGGGPFIRIDSSGEITSGTAPSVDLNAEITFAPPHRELFAVPVAVGGPLYVAVVVGEDKHGNRAFGIRTILGIGLPRIPVSVSGPFDPAEIPTTFDPGG